MVARSTSVSAWLVEGPAMIRKDSNFLSKLLVAWLWQLWSHVSLACELSCSKFHLYVIRTMGWCYAFHIPSILATADVYTLETRSGNTCRDEFFPPPPFHHRGDHTTLPLIHDIILRTSILQDKISGHPILRISYGVSWCWITGDKTNTSTNCLYLHSIRDTIALNVKHLHEAAHYCCKKGICNNTAQLTHVLYTQCSSDNRPAKNLTSYSKPINYYGHYKLGLQLNETLTSNCNEGLRSVNSSRCLL
jgi:hypothetical protein